MQDCAAVRCHNECCEAARHRTAALRDDAAPAVPSRSCAGCLLSLAAVRLRDSPPGGPPRRAAPLPSFWFSRRIHLRLLVTAPWVSRITRRELDLQRSKENCWPQVLWPVASGLSCLGIWQYRLYDALRLVPRGAYRSMAWRVMHTIKRAYWAWNVFGRGPGCEIS